MKAKTASLIEYTGYGLIAAYYLLGCQKKEFVQALPQKPEVILVNTSPFPGVVGRGDFKIIHLYSDTVYVLKDPITRKAGQELVIDEGTLIKVDPGVASADVNAITIEPGATIKANGTREKPVVFTSNALAGSQGNNWAGIFINGKAKNNTAGNAGDTEDYSGSLTFVRIEFAPLVLNAVGNKTIIENVMVSYTGKTGQNPGKSSFSFLGGSFNAKNLVSYACGGGADFYITDGYTGKLLNLLAYRNPLFGETNDAPAGALAGMFISNNEYGDVAALPATYPVISNLTVLGPGTVNGAAAGYNSTDPDIHSAALVMDYNAAFKLRNSLLLGFPRGGIFVNDESSAKNIEGVNTQIVNTYFHANDSARVFVLPDAAYPPYNSYTLAAILLQPSFKNTRYTSPVNGVFDFGFTDPFNYNNPVLVPKDASPVLNGADFNDPFYSNTFFTSVPINHIGAVGKDNWLSGWANFIPLKTNYNFSNYKPF